MLLLSQMKVQKYWRLLDDNLIYFLIDASACYMGPPLTIKNIHTDETIQYQNIKPISLGILNIQNTSLNLLIETQKQTIICKLDRASLSLNIKYKICQLYNQRPFYLYRNILLLIQNRRLIQLNRNKLIRKYKGKFDQILSQDLIAKIGLSQYSLVRFQDQFFYEFQLIFEKSLNITIFDIAQKFGMHFVFKRLGDFLILKKQNKYRKETEQLPIYYISISFKEDCIKGIFFLAKGETLKMISYIDNKLYAVITYNIYTKVYQIKSENERVFIYSIFRSSDVKRPILIPNHLIYTSRLNKYAVILQIDYQKKII